MHGSPLSNVQLEISLTLVYAACFLASMVTIWSQKQKRGQPKLANPLIFMVGGAGIEPATSTV